MFDVSMGELLLVGVVTLVVIGPERMPKVARTAGMLFGRLQRFVNNVKSDLQREMQASELAQIQQEIEAETAAIKNTIHQPLAETRQALSELEADFRLTHSDDTPPATSNAPSNAVAAPQDTAASDQPAASGHEQQPDLFAGLQAGPRPASDRR
ncbi:Sec-independent protein translocase protein TatB [Chitinibacter sp. GC72]|uniref:Sec-independent protein translocase protein TatB n=1 Tax=Chitinibacter sp. GC72 TaxID=1526917 RepID=UPI0012F8043B|nr:Sec-independent protein translocase protein TatB [Chitinibacter sp. GC72]